jgi:hypothetical protein
LRHWIARAIALLVLAGAAPAQERVATVRVASGETIKGRVVAIDLEQITLEVDGNQIRIPTARVTSCDIVMAPAEPAPAPAPAAESAPPQQTQPPATPRPPKAQRRKAHKPTVDGEAAAESTRDPGLQPRIFWKDRIDAFLAAFPWLKPDNWLQFVSLCLTGFGLFGLAIAASIRVVASDPVSFLRCFGIALVSAVLAAAFVAFVPGDPVPLAVAVAVSAMLLVGLFRQAADLGFFESLLALLVLTILLAIGFGVLELTDGALRSAGTVAG